MQISREDLKLLENILWKARLWHSGDKWRFSNDPSERSAWEVQRVELEAAERLIFHKLEK